MSSIHTFCSLFICLLKLASFIQNRPPCREMDIVKARNNTFVFHSHCHWQKGEIAKTGVNDGLDMRTGGGMPKDVKKDRYNTVLVGSSYIFWIIELICILENMEIYPRLWRLSLCQVTASVSQNSDRSWAVPLNFHLPNKPIDTETVIWITLCIEGMLYQSPIPFRLLALRRRCHPLMKLGRKIRMHLQLQNLFHLAWRQSTGGLSSFYEEILQCFQY